MKNLNRNFKLGNKNCSVIKQIDTFSMITFIKKLSVTAYIVLFLFTFNASVFAQEVTPTQIPAENEELTAEESILDGLGQEGFENIGIGESAVDALSSEIEGFEPPVIVRNLLKTTYQVKEKVDIVIDNVAEEEIENYDLTIENTSRQGVDVEVETNFVNEDLVFTINPESGISPGKYKVKVVDIAANKVISEQDFTWGVLAINTDRSIYAPGETADIHMAVLDEAGDMVCDAKVTLTIRAPWGQTTKLSTENNEITVNPDCNIKSNAILPDFQTGYLTTDVGRYLMTLEAETENGTYTITDRFEVRRFVPFDVKRESATRIYPPQEYPVRMTITANEDFKGKIVESVPIDFQIRPSGDGSISYQEVRSLPESFDPQKEYRIPNLPLPFEEEYPQTLGFGQQIDGHGMELVYKRSGIDGHDGVDFALPVGVPVLSVDEGRVILAEENWIYGHTVVIEHEWGRTYYGHLSEITAKEGTSIEQGEILGLSGNTGLSTGPHLHFGLKPRVNEPENLYYGKIDPAPFFGLASVDEELSASDQPIKSKAVVWNVDVKKGSTFTIGYNYKAPEISPYYYKVGPLQFISSELQEDTLPARFDVQVDENPFVLGESTTSAQLDETESATLSAEIVEIENASGSSELESEASAEVKEEPIAGTVVFKEIREWQIAVDAVSYSTSAGAGQATSVSVDIGTAGTNRLVVVYGSSESESATDITGVTVDGNNCNELGGTAATDGEAYNSNGAGNRSEMWYCDEDDLGTSNGTVTAALVGYTTATNWSIMVVVYTGISQSGPKDVGEDTTSVSTTTTVVSNIDVSAGGIVIMGASQGNIAGTRSFTSPLTERQYMIGASDWGSLASGTEVSAQTNKTYTLTWGITHNRSSGVVASWDEAANAPTNSQLLRHGNWFNSGVEQPFYY